VWSFVSGALTCYAVYKLRNYVKARGYELNPGFLFLCIETYCNFERFLFYLLDPMFTRQYLPHYIISPLYTSTTPFTFICCLLITLTWIEIQKKAKYLQKDKFNFLSRKHTIIFMVISLGLVISELVADVYRGLMYNVGTLITVIWSIQGGLGIIFAVLFWVQGFSLLGLIENIQEDGNVGSVVDARKTTKDLMWSGIFLLGFSIMLLLSCAVQIHFGSVVAWYSIQNFWMFFVSLISLTQLLAMPTAGALKSSSSSSRNYTAIDSHLSYEKV